MRRGYDNGLWIEDGKLIGVSLGSDFTSEHEWGIDRLKGNFEIDSSCLGIAARQIQGCPENLIYKVDDKAQKSYLIYRKHWHGCSTWKSKLESCGEVQPINVKSGIGTAWDSDSFGIVFGSETRKYAEDLMDAFKEKDMMIGFTGTSSPFQNPGLFLGIVSRLPKDWIQELYNSDLDYKKRHEHPKHIRIQSILKRSGKSFFALSPSWADENEKDLQWWLNPRQQVENNYGWYTYSDLLAWTRNEGPIPKVVG